MKKAMGMVFLTFLLCPALLNAQEGTIPLFKLEPNDLTLQRLAKPGTPFDKCGRRFVILGDESGSFEAWAYPLKLLRSFTFSFFVKNSTHPIHGRDIVRYISVFPEATTLTYTYQSFTVKAIFMVPVEEPGAMILLHVDSTEPLTIVCGFLPVLQPMWPAGMGGQYAYWSDELKAYIISESSRKNHGIIGSPAASGLSYTPAHMLSDAPSEFRIDIPEPDQIRSVYIPIYLAGGIGKREDVIKVYQQIQTKPEKLYQKNVDHYRKLREDTLRILTPNPELNLAFEWAKVTFDNLIVENPNLGKGLVAGLGASGTSGRPGFGWYFGGDAFINCFSLASYGAHQTVREVLAFNQKWQRKDGKMAHELSQAEGYIDWWNDYHFGYIHGDTTPYYIAAMYDYVRLSGDEEFLESSWDSLYRAYEWCLSTDKNGDGLMDNKEAGLGALEFGELTGIETDIYLAAVWVQAAYAMERLADIVGQKAYSRQAKNHYQKAKQAFDHKFWDQENQFYTYAFNAQGQQVKEISPWNAIGLMWDFGTEKRSLRSLEKLSSSELMTDWGVRSISMKSQYFQPLNYNYGAVWPFITSWVTAALYRHNMPLNAYALLMATAQHTFEHALGGIGEVFSGTNYVWPQESVSHQGFSSAGVTLSLIRGLAGLSGDAHNKTVRFAPQFPPDWDHVRIENYKVGAARFSFDYTKNTATIDISVKSSNAEGYRIHMAPALSLGSVVNSVTTNGDPAAFETRQKAQSVQPLFEIPAPSTPIDIKIAFTPTLEILPVIPQSKVGDPNQCLKIISLRKNNSIISIKVEGLLGMNYEIGVLNSDLITKIAGAALEPGKLKIRIPLGPPGEFIPHLIQLHLK